MLRLRSRSRRVAKPRIKGATIRTPMVSPSHHTNHAKAVLAHDPKQVDQLLEKGESINDRVRPTKGARAGFTPLILAASMSAAEMTEFLLQRGAKVTDVDDYHRSAFWYAALNQSVGVATVLSKAPGAKDVINEPDGDFKRTPLHVAVHGTSPEMVKLLLEAGASLDQRDVLEETPNEFCKRRPTEACTVLRR